MKKGKDWKPFIEALLTWYHQNKRDLPWRRTQDPYTIWISEIMLQQTQVKTAIPYFEKFIGRFPGIDALAKASLQEVLKNWEGLGYYSRARHLHSAAKEVRIKYAGRFPEDRETLLSLPGIGLYTAGAIASIAFGKPTPVVDGNVWRVFSRILADGNDAEHGKKALYQLLEEIIPASDPSSFNQALMELGALICTPKAPQCGICPVRKFCRARASKQVERFPVKALKRRNPHKVWVTLLVADGKRFLIEQRPLQGIWGGLWIFPSLPVEQNEILPAVKKLAKQFSLSNRPSFESLPSIDHAFTHFKLTLHPYFVRSDSSEKKKGATWIDPSDNPYPMPAPYLKILKLLDDSPKANAFVG